MENITSQHSEHFYRKHFVGHVRYFSEHQTAPPPLAKIKNLSVQLVDVLYIIQLQYW